MGYGELGGEENREEKRGLRDPGERRAAAVPGTPN
jgi:hypothetical protein